MKKEALAADRALSGAIIPPVIEIVWQRSLSVQFVNKETFDKCGLIKKSWYLLSRWTGLGVVFCWFLTQ
jgi:hypothetical protein